MVEEKIEKYYYISGIQRDAREKLVNRQTKTKNFETNLDEIFEKSLRQILIKSLSQIRMKMQKPILPKFQISV